MEYYDLLSWSVMTLLQSNRPIFGLCRPRSNLAVGLPVFKDSNMVADGWKVENEMQ